MAHHSNINLDMTLRNFFGIMLMAIFLSCGDDGSLAGEDILHYDGENQTAPALPPGSYNVAIRFTTNLLRNVEGRSIDAVNLYLYDRPANARLTISYDVSPRLPANPIYTQDITAQLSADRWNTIALDTPFEITGEPLWIGVAINLNSPRRTIGCDAGPGNPNGDWLFDAADMEWLRFEERVGDSINWNIRAVLAP